MQEARIIGYVKYETEGDITGCMEFDFYDISLDEAMKKILAEVTAKKGRVYNISLHDRIGFRENMDKPLHYFASALNGGRLVTSSPTVAGSGGGAVMIGK